MTGFSGTTAECLIDLGTRYPGMESRRLLATFCQVVVHPTTREWTSGERVPKGEALLRVRAFLTLAGYLVSEVEELPGVAREFMMLMATDVVKIEDAQRELGYKNVDGLYDITLRAKSPLRDKLFRLEQLLRLNHDTLQGVLDARRSVIAQTLQGVDVASEVHDGQDDVAKKVTSEVPTVKKSRSRSRKRRTANQTSAPTSNRDQNLDEGDGADVMTAKIMANLADAMGALVAGRRDDRALIEAVARRVGHKQLRALYSFLGSVQESTTR